MPRVAPAIVLLSRVLHCLLVSLLTAGTAWSCDPACERVTLRALWGSLELRDPLTGSHSFRVGKLARCLAPALGIDPERAERAGRLHDIGKLALPDRILSGKAGLAASERLRVRLHPVHGRALARKLDLAQDLIDAVGCHHERWDGTGYPEGRAGSCIPQLARLVAVADVLDAITARRSYKAARSLTEAMGALRSGSGSQFDPTVVEAAEELRDQLDELIREFQARDHQLLPLSPTPTSTSTSTPKGES